MIEFSCEYCGQPMSASPERAGQRARCPKCRGYLQLPAAASAEPQPTNRPALSPLWLTSDDAGAAPGPFPLDVPTPPEPVRPAAPVDASRVTLPRYVLFAQGVLLGIVGLVAYALGMLAGSSGKPSLDLPRDQQPPCVVTGHVEYTTSGGTNYEDGGAVVVLFPADDAPSADDRLPTVGLRPDDPPPPDNHPALQALKTLGGNYTRTDAEGYFRMSLPHGGRFYFLVISHRGQRRSGREIGRADLAAMGRYVAAAGELIADRRYTWRNEELQRAADLPVVLGQ